jgi:FMN phosphatase YigB (HAD superfamily)
MTFLEPENTLPEVPNRTLQFPTRNRNCGYDGLMPWISFDLDGTICDFPMYHAVFKTMRADWPEMAREALGMLYRERLGSENPISAFNWDEMNAIIANQFHLPALPEILEFAQTKDFDLALVYPDTQPALHTLRKNGWRIACGTNGFAKYQAYALMRLGIEIETFISPDTVGFAKPQAEFLHCLPQVSSDKNALEGLVHVGDILTQDVLAANRSGVTSVWVWREMPTEIRSIPAEHRAKDPTVVSRIQELAEMEFEVHGRMDATLADFPPRPDHVVCDLNEMAGILCQKPER